MQLAINYSDGAFPEHLTSRERKYAVKEKPGLLSYCSYMFNLQSSIFGPSFEFNDWDSFINLKRHYGQMRPCSNYVSAIFRFGQGILFFGIGVFLQSCADPWHMCTPEFGEYAYWYKMAYLFVGIEAYCTQLIGGLVFGESCMLAAGFGY